MRVSHAETAPLLTRNGGKSALVVVIFAVPVADEGALPARKFNMVGMFQRGDVKAGPSRQTARWHRQHSNSDFRFHHRNSPNVPCSEDRSPRKDKPNRRKTPENGAAPSAPCDGSSQHSDSAVVYPRRTP